MIARMTARGLKDIEVIGEYLEHGSEQNGNYTEDPSTRVGHTSTRELFAESREEIVAAMKRLAGKSEATQPALHLIVSWEPGDELRGIESDNPTPEEMDAVVDRLMDALMLQEHQAWVVEHIDTDTPHLHALINGVNPRTKTRTWKRDFFAKRLIETAQQLEREYGWHPASDKTLDEMWAEDTLRESYWERNWEELGRDMPYIVKARIVTGPMFEESESWPELVDKLDELDLKLEPRYDRGMVLTTGVDFTRLSRIHPDYSRPKLEARFGMSWNEYRQLVGDGYSHEEIIALANEPERVEAEMAEGEESAPETAGAEQTPAGQPAGTTTPERPHDPSTGDGLASDESLSQPTPAFAPIDTDSPILPGGSTPPGGGSWHDYLAGLSVDATSRRETRPSGGLNAPRRRGLPLGLPSSTTARKSPHVMNERTGYDPPSIAAGDEKVKEALAFADQYFKDTYKALPEDHPAKVYVRDRLGGPEASSDEYAVEAGVGYAPDDWNDFVDAAEAAGIDPDALEEAGLAVSRRDGNGQFATFRGRMMFAMTDYDGTVRGFGGRRIEGMERETPTLDGFPKYINSREGDLFDKKEVLFGASEVRDMRGPVFITEGYLDALQMQRAGFRAVALAGTRMSEQHAAQVNAMMGPQEQPVIMLDGDEAGINNTDEVVVRLVEDGTRPTVVRLPDGMDADTFVQSQGREGVMRFHGRNAERWSDYIYHRVIEQHGGSDPIARRDAYERMLGVISSAPTERSRERLFLDAYATQVGDSFPVTPEMDSSVERRFEAYRDAYETKMREEGAPVRSWSEARADYPELRGEPVREVGESGATEMSAPYSKDLYTPLRQLEDAMEAGEEPPELTDLAMEWNHLEEEAAAIQDRYESLQGAWEEALIASFEDPEEAISAHAKNQAYHSPVDARAAVLFPESYQGAFARVPNYKEAVDVEEQQAALLDLHEKMTEVERRMEVMAEYADEITQAFTEQNTRETSEERALAAEEAERERQSTGAQPGAQPGPQDATNLDPDDQPQQTNERTNRSATSRDAAGGDGVRRDERERPGSVQENGLDPNAVSEGGRTGSGNDPLANRPFAPPAEGPEGRVYPGSASPNEGDPDPGGPGDGRDSARGGEAGADDQPENTQGRAAGGQVGRREGGQRPSENGPADAKDGQAEDETARPRDSESGAGESERAGLGRDGREGAGAARDAGPDRGGQRNEREDQTTGRPGQRNRSGREAGGPGNDEPAERGGRGRGAGDHREERAGQGGRAGDVRRPDRSDRGLERADTAPVRGNKHAGVQPNQQEDQPRGGLRREAGQEHPEVAGSGQRDAQAPQGAAEQGGGPDQDSEGLRSGGAGRVDGGGRSGSGDLHSVGDPVLKDLSPEQAEAFMESVDQRYTSRVGDLGDLGPGDAMEVEARPGNGAYEFSSEQNVMQFFDKLRDRLEKTVDQDFENRRTNSPARLNALDAIKKAEQEDPNAKRWRGLGTLVRKEVDRRYSVHEAKQIYKAIDRANEAERLVDLDKELKGIANHDTYEAYQEQVETYFDEFKDRMGSVYVDGGEAAAAFSKVAREDGFQEAMRVMTQEPSRYGDIRSDQDQLWKVRQDFGRSVGSPAQAICEYDKGGIGRAAAKAQVAAALEVEMRARTGEQVPSDVRSAVQKEIESLKAEYKRVKYQVVHEPEPAILQKEAGRMLDQADGKTHEHVRTLSEGAQERITLAKNSQQVLQTSDRVDNLFREIYASPEDARVRFENAAFPNGISGDTDEYKQAIGALARNPENFGALRRGLSQEQSKKLGKKLVKEMSSHVAATEQLKASLKSQDAGATKNGRQLKPGDALDKAKENANPSKYLRSQMLVRTARTLSARVKESAGFDRF